MIPRIKVRIPTKITFFKLNLIRCLMKLYIKITYGIDLAVKYEKNISQGEKIKQTVLPIHHFIKGLPL